MLHRLLLAAIVGASVLAHGQAVASDGEAQSSVQDTEVIAVPWQGPNENEIPRETEVDREIEAAPNARVQEGLVEAEITYEDTFEDLESPLPAPMPFPIGSRP